MTVTTTHHTDATGNALYAAILANPFDLLPRLVYADWLDENAGNTETCPECRGYGKVYHDGGSLFPSAIVGCLKCDGTGRVPNHCAERAEFIRLDCEPGGIGHGDARRLWHRHNADLWAGDLYSAGLVTVSPACREPAYQTDAWRAVVRNGFVEDIRCPLEWWTGGECDCDDGYTGTPRDCPRCHGTGRTPGHGPEVVSRHPVTRVVATPDPIWQRTDGKWVAGVGRWLGAVVGTDPSETPLPDDVWQAFSDTDKGWPYPSREAAVEALSRALVDWAREQAGLNPIPWEVSR